MLDLLSGITSISAPIKYQCVWICLTQGIDSDIEEVARPNDNSDPIADGAMDDNGDEFPPLEDITTIPEEASEELREEEEEEAAAAAAAAAAASLEATAASRHRTPELLMPGVIGAEAEKPSK